MTVPYTFGTATTSIPLSNLDANFNTPITLGNTSIYLGNTTTTIGNLTLTNVTISSGSANITSNITYATANAVVYTNSSNVGITSTSLTFNGTNLGIGTSSPQSTYKLTISGTDTIFPAVYLENTTNSKAYSMRATSTSWVIRDNTAGADRITLDTSGNVGIGTSSPATKLNIENAGECQLQMAYSSTIFGRVGRLSSGNYEFSSYENGANLLFGTTTTNGSTTERMRITSGGVLDIGTGAGAVGQIQFPATQVPSANANTLDDYEEGTWTPVIVGGTTAGTGTYASQLGRYTKIGNFVRISFSVAWSAHTGTGTTIITGFPFANNSGAQIPFSVFTYGETFTALNVANGGLMSNGATQWEHWQVPTGGGNSSGIPIYNGSAEIQVSGIYQTT